MLEKAAEIGLAQAKEQLAGIDFGRHEDILFVGKSIGTTAATQLAEDWVVSNIAKALRLLFSCVKLYSEEFVTGVNNGIRFMHSC